MAKQIIKSWVTGAILYEIEAETFSDAVKQIAREGESLEGADLDPIKSDFFLVLLSAPKEIGGLRKAIVEGRINGSQYEGECACLVGTIANVAGVNYCALPKLNPDQSRPAERFFLGIKKGDTPENSQFSKIVLGWLDEFVAQTSQVEKPESATA